MMRARCIVWTMPKDREPLDLPPEEPETVEEASQADKTADAIDPSEPWIPFPQPPVTEDDIRRAYELIEENGWHHLLRKP